jgi:glutaredoxin-like protein
MEKFLNNDLQKQLRGVFNKNLKEPVRLVYFESADQCEYCDETRRLLDEVIALTDKITLEAHDLDKEADLAGKYRLDKTPGFMIAAVENDKIVDYGIRYAGIPAGHEFNSLVNDLVLVSQRDSGLKPETREFLKGLNREVKLQVFVTPSCSYCPQAVNLAHAMALESPFVQAEMVEATEFPDLADRFNVSGVPQTTINDGRGTMVGAAPEQYLVEEIKKALLN